MNLAASRVGDPHSFDTNPDPALQAEYRSGSSPDLIRIQGFDDQKLEKKIWGSKTTIYLSIGLHEGRTSYKRSLQLSKANIQHFKT
jgi:hypothetical protein